MNPKTLSQIDTKTDVVAKYLRETLQAGKRLTPWESTPKATKKKWLELAAGVLSTLHGQQSEAVASVSEPANAPALESKPVEWLWWGQDARSKDHVSFGRWQKHPCQAAGVVEALRDSLKEFVDAAERTGVKHDALRNRVDRAEAALIATDGEAGS